MLFVVSKRSLHENRSGASTGVKIDPMYLCLFGAHLAPSTAIQEMAFISSIAPSLFATLMTDATTEDGWSGKYRLVPVSRGRLSV